MMVFKSFYTRIIFILSTMSLVLFIILAFVNVIVFRNEFQKSFGKLEQPRIEQLFAILDNHFESNYSPEKVKSKIDSLKFEFNVDVFDRKNNWITGSHSILKNVVEKETSKQLVESKRFTGLSKIYFNPNVYSPFYAIKIHVRFVDSPIFNRVFLNFLLSGVFVILISALVGWRLVYYLNKRLDRLKKGVSKISKGEFDIQLEDDGRDEIAFLAKNFNHMSGEIKKLIHSLEESNAARQRLIAHASHEIKSPLTSIKGFVDILEFMNVLSEEQQKNLLPVVKKDLNRVIKITNDMLQLAQIRDPEYQIIFKQINLMDFLLEEHSHFAHKASANNVTAIYENKVAEKITLDVDGERLSQILDNLWNNALKYGDHNFPIQTEIFLVNEEVGIKISNHLQNRIDIPPERLFEPFYRSPNISEKVSGAGLGLSIVKELTEKMGGRIVPKLTDEKIEITLFFKLQQNPPVEKKRKTIQIPKLKKKR
ncbi:HAMP domain-containing histidine kinase [candidate division KSB1 bacterium]|nr:HAMP domain-containing histidine kinase [candidate division KSB1 bacterium]